MSIGRHNYEEFFILYMDNELNPAQRRVVEAFVEQNPDLKEELELLRQFKLEPDTDIVFDRKEELMLAMSDPSISLSNYPDWFLLYIDNELTVAEKRSVEEFIEANPGLKSEFDTLSRTKLQPEEIVFKHKSALYRTEKVRVIPVRWYRVAAAAVLVIGIGLTTMILVRNNKGTTTPPIVKTNPGKKTDAIVPKESIADNSLNIDQKKISKKDNLAKNKTIPVQDKKDIIENPQSRQEEVIAKIENDKPSNNLPQPEESNPNLRKVNETSVAGIIREDISTDVTKPTPQSYVFTKASYPEPADEEETDQSDKKNKLRGLFRKVTRTFEKRTNIDATGDDDKLLVAGLAIKLK